MFRDIASPSGREGTACAVHSQKPLLCPVGRDADCLCTITAACRTIVMALYYDADVPQPGVCSLWLNEYSGILQNTGDYEAALQYKNLFF
jgi:hypothetical protein